ncbi:MAG TPA: ABC transporter ATP-binding protein [Crocinitomicaceae bacterium]|nr:ATP-binding cassette domain-containing protein [Flavobacteriales bacterium]HBW86308.1 ABC transporter ATP-binding protein [Crocinitomicaceae bacterium]
MLEVKEISKSFGKKNALDAVSITAQSGEIFGLLGPNGAGKTTLIRIINTIIRQDSGEVLWNGKPIRLKNLNEIGYLPEERGLYRSMQVIDHLIFLGRMRGLTSFDAARQSKKWLEEFEIAHWSKNKIENLSKGMSQKVQFIGAVLHDPSLVILDEPLSGFDPLNVQLILDRIHSFKKEGKTILLSTHNMRSVDQICDRIALIYQSEKLVEDGVWNLRDRFKQDEFTIRFKGNMVALANGLWTGFELIQKEDLGENRFLVRVRKRGENSINELMTSLMNHIQIEAIEEYFPDMHEVFVQLIEEKDAV